MCATEIKISNAIPNECNFSRTMFHTFKKSCASSSSSFPAKPDHQTF